MKFVFLLLSSVTAFMNRTDIILSVQENDDGSLFQTAYPYNYLSPGLLRTVLRSLHHAATATMLRTSWRNFRCTYNFTMRCNLSFIQFLVYHNTNFSMNFIQNTKWEISHRLIKMDV
jgi:hypothetical protein